MKKIFVIVLVCAMLFLFSGCDNSIYFEDIEDYNEVWELSGYGAKEDGALPIFPSEIKDLDVIDFYCKYKEKLPLGEEIQVYLQVRYDDSEAFEKEKERLITVARSCDELFDNTDLSAFCVQSGEGYMWEYSLADDIKSEIYYIFVKDIPKSEILFDSKLLPKEYDY